MLKYFLDIHGIFNRQGTLQKIGETPVNIEQWLELIQVRCNKINWYILF